MNAPCDILIVDDEESITELLADVLTDVGYTVQCAYDGASALVAVQEQLPALILLDNMMPILSGIEVVRTLRAAGYTQLPIIMMSAGTAAEPLRQAGATTVLPKPFMLDEVVSCIERYCGRAWSPPVRPGDTLIRTVGR